MGFIFSVHGEAGEGEITCKGSERQRQHLLAKGVKGDTKSSFTGKKRLTALLLGIMKRYHLLTPPAHALLLERGDSVTSRPRREAVQGPGKEGKGEPVLKN